MNSPARASMQRKLAALGANIPTGPIAGPMPEDGEVATEYQHLLMALGVDLRRLQSIQSREHKIEAKREMIDRYLAWVDGALRAEHPAQDEIVANMLIWSIDLADWPLAINIARHVIEHGLRLPERYKRNPAALIAEEVAEAGLQIPPTVDYDVMIAVDALTAGHDMHDQIRAKLKKAIGLALHYLANNFDPEAENALAGGKAALISAALGAFKTAVQLDKSVGVKKLIETLEREQRKLADPQSEPQPDPETPATPAV